MLPMPSWIVAPSWIRPAMCPAIASSMARGGGAGYCGGGRDTATRTSIWSGLSLRPSQLQVGYLVIDLGDDNPGFSDERGHVVGPEPEPERAVRPGRRERQEHDVGAQNRGQVRVVSGEDIERARLDQGPVGTGSGVGGEGQEVTVLRAQRCGAGDAREATNSA